MRRRGVSACMCGGPVTALGTDKWDYLTPGRVLVAWFHCLRAVRVMGRYDTRVCTTLSLGQAGGRHRDRKLETWANPRTGRFVPRVSTTDPKTNSGPRPHAGAIGGVGATI